MKKSSLNKLIDGSSKRGTTVYKSPKHELFRLTDDNGRDDTTSKAADRLKIGQSSVSGEHHLDVETQLASFYESKALCDLSLVLGYEKFCIHAIALSRCSFKYRRILTEARPPLTEIELPAGVSPESVREVVRFMYKNRVELSGQNVSDVLTVGVFLAIDELVIKCFEYIRHCSDQEITHFLVLGERLELVELRNMMLNLAKRNIRATVESSEFHQVTVDDVEKILSSSEAHAEGEHLAFLAAIKWLRFSPDRAKLGVHLLKFINLEQVRPFELSAIEEIADLVNIPAVKRMLCRAYKHHALSRIPESSVDSSVDESLADGFHKKMLKIPAIVLAGGRRNDESTAPIDEISFCNVGETQQNWNSLTNMPDHRSFHCAVYFQNNIFILGGFDTMVLDSEGNRRPTKKVLRYDLTAGQWKSVAHMTSRRAYFAAVVLDNFVYAIGGLGDNNKALASVEYFNPRTNEWNEFPSLPIKSIGLAACAHSGSIFVMGGCVPTFGHMLTMSMTLFFNFELYRWENRSPTLIKLFYSTAVESNGSLYMVGGAVMEEPNDGEEVEPWSLDQILEYDDTTDEWTVAARLPSGRHWASVVAVGKMVHIIGGSNYDQLTPLSTVFSFNVETYLLERSISNIPYPMLGAAACIVDNTDSQTREYRLPL